MGKGKKEKKTDEALAADRTVRKKTERNPLSIDEEDIIRSKDIRLKMHRRKVSKIVAVFLIVALMVSGAAWGVMTLVENNSVRIKIGKGTDGLSLSGDSDFTSPTTSMRMPGPEEMRDISYYNIDVARTVMGQEGSHNGASYIAYSIYLKNVSTVYACTYSVQMSIMNKIKALDEALRVMIVYTDEAGDYTATVFARPRADGTPEAVAYDSDDADTQRPISLDKLNAVCGETPLYHTEFTEPFEGVDPDEGVDYIVRRDNLYLSCGGAVKYTVVIWIEGSDAQCVDVNRGGFVSLNLQFDLQSNDESSFDPDLNPFG